MEKKLEDFLREEKAEGQRHRRELEVYGGVALVLASLCMAVVFLFALRYSQAVSLMMFVSGVFLVGALLLFAAGLWTVVVGRKRLRQ